MGGPAEIKKETMSITWMEGVRLAVEVRDQQIVVDQPEDEGGQGQGITPVEMFVGSLGGCIGYFAARFCQRHNIPADGLKVTMEWDYAERPHRVGSMTAHVDLPAPLDPKMKERLQQVLEGCTVHESLINPPQVSVVIH